MTANYTEMTARLELQEPAVIVSPPREKLSLAISNPSILMYDLLKNATLPKTVKYIRKMLIRGKARHIISRWPSDHFITYSISLEDIQKHSADVILTLPSKEGNKELEYSTGIHLIFSTTSKVYDLNEPYDSFENSDKGTFKWRRLNKPSDKYRGMIYKLEDTDFSAPPYGIPKKGSSNYCSTFTLLVLYEKQTAKQILLASGLAQMGKRDNARKALANKITSLESKVIGDAVQVQQKIANKLEFSKVPPNIEAEKILYVDKLEYEELGFFHDFFTKFAGRLTVTPGAGISPVQFLLGADVFVDARENPSELLWGFKTPRENPSDNSTEIFSTIFYHEMLGGGKVAPIGFVTGQRVLVCISFDTAESDGDFRCALLFGRSHAYQWKSFAAMLEDVAENGLEDLLEPPTAGTDAGGKVAE